RARLEAIAAARAQDTTTDGYRIGPDDLLEVRIPDLLEVTGSPAVVRGARVGADGRITLPVVGMIDAAGRTAPALEQDIAHRLIAAGILRRPQVSVQIVEYRSR